MSRSRTAAHWGAFIAEAEEGRLIGMRPDEGDPDPSPIGQSMLDSLDPSVRIAQPMVRRGYLEKGRGSGGGRGEEPFVPVDWEQAVELAAAALAGVKAEHGNEAIFGGSYGWASAGRFHHAQSQVHRFLNLFGGYTRSVNTYSTGAAEVILPHVVGARTNLLHRNTSWSRIAAHCELFLAFGGIPLKNAQVSTGFVGRHGVRERVAQCRGAGVDFVNLSPLRDDMPAEAEARWLPVRPNTDTALMLALGYQLLADGAVDVAFMASRTTGFERLRAYLLGAADGQARSPEWAAPITGLEAHVIRDLARQMAARRTFISCAYSLQRAANGEQPFWMAIVLAAMLGGIGRPGQGVGFGYGAFNGIGEAWAPLRWGSLPQGRNAVSRFIPVARIADMLLNPGAPFRYNGGEYRYPDIRLVYWAGGNPFHHHQDLLRLREAFRRPETVIVHDPFWTGTARHADIVLPATTALERCDFACNSQDLSISPMHQVVPPCADARSDYAIFALLAEALGFGEAFTEGRDEMAWVRHLYELTRERAAAAGYELPGFDDFWAGGLVTLPAAEEFDTPLERFAADPQGQPLDTPSGRIEVYSETIAGFGLADVAGHPAWREPPEWLGGAGRPDDRLHLVSNQPSRRLHSQLNHGRHSRAGQVAGCEPVRINPADAERRGIRDGQRVRLFNERGATLAGAVVTDAVARGVVQLSTGAAFELVTGPDGRPLERHGNPNVLTADRGASSLSQAPSPLSTLVAIAPADDC